MFGSSAPTVTGGFAFGVSAQAASVGLELFPPTVKTTDEDWQTKRATIRGRNELMFNNSLLSDIKFAFSDQNGKEKTIPAHKYVLAISSPVFFSMFYSELAERNDTIEITDCDSESFLEMLRFIYSDKANLSNCDQALHVWYSAQKYFIPSLVKKYVTYLDENVGVNDVLDVLPYAVKFEEEALQATCWKIIDFHAQVIMKSDIFLDLDRGLLVDMLKRISLRVDEIKLFKSVDRWAQRKCEEGNIETTGENKREVIGEDLFRLVRFPILKQEDFAQKVLPTNLLTNQEVIDIFKHFSSVRVETLRFPTESRQKYPEVIRCHRFNSASHGWSNKNVLDNTDTLVMSVSKPVALCGFSLFGTHEAEYTVDLKLLRNEEPSAIIARCSGTYVTNRSLTIANQTAARGFDCLFRTPVRLMENIKYTVQAIINGPDSYFGLASDGFGRRAAVATGTSGFAFSFAGVTQRRAATSNDSITLSCKEIDFTFYANSVCSRTTHTNGQIPTVIFMIT